MIELEKQLVAKLQHLDVEILVRDGNTVVFRNVPVHPRCFNKPATNLLIQRARKGMPFLIGVDADIEYTGPDSELTRLFAGGMTREGWRVLHLAHLSRGDPQDAVEAALTLLGFEGQEPALPPPPQSAPPADEPPLLTSLATNLSRRVLDGTAEPTVGRAEEIEEVLACALRWGQARLALIVAESGCGKTNLLHGVAHRLRECRPDLTLLSLPLAHLFAGSLFDADRENLFVRLLKEAQAGPLIVAIEHLDLALREIPHGRLLLTQALDEGVRLIGTTLPDPLRDFEAPPLARRLHLVHLSEPSARETAAILAACRDHLVAHYHVEIDDTCLQACVRAAEERLPGHFPAKALALLDAAASKTALAGAPLVGPDEICYAVTRLTE
jgi:ATP-dependent Clp protease ATP-binding subunit ClpA